MQNIHFSFSSSSIPKPGKRQCGDAFVAESIATPDGTFLLLAVADGVSSCSSDHVASHKACTTFLHHFHYLNGDISARMLPSLKEAQRALLEISENGKRYLCTFSCLLLDIKKMKAHLLHIGDSRIYRLVHKKWDCLTKDDSIRKPIRLKDGHQLHLHFREYLTKALGGEGADEPFLQTFDVLPDDTYILSTDGWYKREKFEQEIQDVTESADMAKRIRELSAAIAHEPEDDATVVIVRFEGGRTDDEEIRRMITDQMDYRPSFSQASMSRHIHSVLKAAVTSHNHSLTGQAIRYMQQYSVYPSKEHLMEILDEMSRLSNPNIQQLALIIRKL